MVTLAFNELRLTKRSLDQKYYKISKLMTMSLQQCQTNLSSVFIVNFEHVQYINPFQAKFLFLHPFFNQKTSDFVLF